MQVIADRQGRRRNILTVPVGAGISGRDDCVSGGRTIEDSLRGLVGVIAASTKSADTDHSISIARVRALANGDAG